MSFPREGGCQCGAIRYVVRAAPRLVFACHCTACQRRSGAATVVSLIVREADFHLTQGRLRPQTRLGDSGGELTHWFCAACGTPILGMKRGDGEAAYETVRLGTLDDISDIVPSVHCWTRSAQGWVVIPPDTHNFAGNPTVPMLSLAP